MHHTISACDVTSGNVLNHVISVSILRHTISICDVTPTGESKHCWIAGILAGQHLRVSPLHQTRPAGGAVHQRL